MEPEHHYPSREVDYLSAAPKRKRWLAWLALSIGAIIIFLLPFGLWYSTQPPTNFPTDSTLEIAAGSNAAAIAGLLAEEGYVRSRWLFLGLATVRGDVSNLKAGRYQFSEPYQAVDILDRLAAGDYFNSLVRVTHVEGQRVAQLAVRLEGVLPGFIASEFIALAEPYEGKLFPDTYYVPESYTPLEMLTLLRDQYEQAISPFRIAIARSPLSEREVIILASILEREANSPESKQMVSGVLQNRLAIDMPLQADATIEYVLDKPLSALIPADLEIDSPYNTYLYNGLPPTPIGNPGRAAIEAAINPSDTEYFYYITDPNGEFHYARDFDTHRENIARYLRR